MDSVHAGEIFEFLYGVEGVGAARRRYLELIDKTLSFADQPVLGVQNFPEVKGDLRIFTAAGRTELGGNHTDHNQGKVLAAAIQLDIVAVAAKRKDKTVIFRSVGYPDVVVSLDDLSIKPDEKGSTESLIRGIANEFSKQGGKIGGWTANAASTVLPGSGLSSSAAIEVLFGTIFDHFYGEGKRNALEIAGIGQKAENDYFGKPSGLMDQISCASGGAVAIDFAVAGAPVLTPVHFNPEDAGFALCIVNTRSSHADLTASYAAIPEEMCAVASFFGKRNLRALSLEAVLERASEIRRTAGDRALMRSIHFFKENRRVDKLLIALQKYASGNEAAAFSDYLTLVNQSGDSSWELLQNVLAPKNAREQGLALALALTKDFIEREAGSGACRVHGGGFAGTIQVYLPYRTIDRYTIKMEAVFGIGAVTVIKIRSIGASELSF
jgi:galactokinase